MDIIHDKKIRGWVLFTVALSTFMATLDSSIVNIALPVIGKFFASNISMTSWIVSGYLVSISALLLLWGRLSDYLGQKRLFVWGLALFVVGSLFCGLSQSLAWLVISRILQGIGASITMALVQGIVTAIFPPEERGRSLGMIGTVVALGSLVGPSLGSLFIAFLSWQFIFYINIPIGILAILLTVKLLPDTDNSAVPKDFDWSGGVFLIVWVICAFASLMAYSEHYVSLQTAGIALVITLVMGFLIWRYEGSRKTPILPVVLFKSQVFSSGVLTAYISYGTMFTYIILMPYYLQQARGLSVIQTGLLMSIYPLTTGVVAPVSGHLSDKLTFKPLTLMGMGFMTLAYLMLSFLSTETSLIWIGAGICFLGFSTALFQSPNTSSIMGAVQRNQVGSAGSISAFFRNFGMVTGTALAILLYTVFTQTGFDSVKSSGFDPEVFMMGFSGVMRVAAAVALLGFGISIGRKITDNR